MFTVISLGLLLLAVALVVAIVMAMRNAANRGWRFELSRVIGDAFGAIAQAPVLFLSIAVAANVAPLLVFGLGVGGLAAFGFDSADTFAGGLGVVGPLVLILAHFGHMMLVAATLDVLAGRPVAPGGLFGSVVPLLPAGIAIAVLFWIAIAIGFLFFVVPALLLACLWFVVTPTLIAERGGVFASFARSAALTAGVRWHLALLLAVGGIVWLVVQLMIGTVVGLFGSLAGAGVAYVILTAAMSVLSPTVIASTYHALRTQKEGLRGDELERVFA